jgi:putative dehydrogenase
MRTVGLIGIGLMGAALARRLLDSGFSVVGFDVDPAKRTTFAAMGGQPAETVAEVAARCRVYLIAVMTIAQVEQVVEGPGGLLDSGSAETRVAMCTSTCEPDRIEALAGRAAARGLAYGLIAGDKAAAETAGDILSVIYPRHQFVGPAGAATKTKLAVNHILGLNRVALAEGLVFAEKLGLDLHNFLDVARKSAAYSQIMDVKGDKMVDGDFTPVSKVSQHLKDVRVMVSEARRRGQALPFASVLVDVLEGCERHGDGERDNAISIDEIRRRTSAA